MQREKHVKGNKKSLPADGELKSGKAGKLTKELIYRTCRILKEFVISKKETVFKRRQMRSFNSYHRCYEKDRKKPFLLTDAPASVAQRFQKPRIQFLWGSADISIQATRKWKCDDTVHNVSTEGPMDADKTKLRRYMWIHIKLLFH